MKNSNKTLEFKFERTIPALPGEVFDGWLNPKILGNPWHEADKLILNPKVDGFFYWLIRGNPLTGDLRRWIDRAEFSIPGCHAARWEKSRRLP
jgi:hypothetical protein